MIKNESQKSLSIITPHYNDFSRLKKIYNCLVKQTNPAWEWVVVDDLSDEHVREDLVCYFNNLADDRLQLILNTQKSNASVCRNIGAEQSSFKRLVFLDSDDLISLDFVANRQIDFKDFVIFSNYQIVNKKGDVSFKNLNSNWRFLDRFLSAQFLWQTSCILWDKDFFNVIGKFHPELPRLQDVELSIKALQNSSSYSFIDNPIDFFYQVKPIRERKNFVKPVCEAVYLFISELLDTSKLNVQQTKMLSSYYYLCTKYFERSESFDDISLVRKNLKLFYTKRFISKMDYVFGDLALRLYTYKLLSRKTFLRANRYLFKT